jgi:hypothetical protein
MGEREGGASEKHCIAKARISADQEFYFYEGQA